MASSKRELTAYNISYNDADMRDDLFNQLKSGLTPYIKEYKTHQENMNSVKDSPLPVKAFFEFKHYLKTLSGEKGYIRRLNFIREAREVNNLSDLLKVMKKYYYESVTGCIIRSYTTIVIMDVCFSTFNITPEMITERAKEDDVPKRSVENGSETENTPGVQEIARHKIIQSILKGDFEAIRNIRIKSLINKDNEIEMQTICNSM